MQYTKLPLNPPVIAGKTIQMRNNGLGERGTRALIIRKKFQAIEPVQAKVLNGDAFHEEFFVTRYGFVLRVEGITKALEGSALAGRQVGEKEFIGSAQAVLEGIHARAVLTVRSFSHDIEMVEVKQ